MLAAHRSSATLAMTFHQRGAFELHQENKTGENVIRAAALAQEYILACRANEENELAEEGG